MIIITTKLVNSTQIKATSWYLDIESPLQKGLLKPRIKFLREMGNFINNYVTSSTKRTKQVKIMDNMRKGCSLMQFIQNPNSRMEMRTHFLY